MNDINKLGFHYRIMFYWHRAMLLAFFYDDEKAQHHASKIMDYVNWGSINLKY